MAGEKFESSLKKLEDAVTRLESGDLTLEESLKIFEEGIKHAAVCTRKLNEAEQRVELLLRQRDGSLSRTPFSVDEDV